MMEYLDSEHIILEVKKHPCIYNISHPDYKNRDLKRNAWISIAKIVVENWEAVDETKKANIGKEVQKRWKSMKDSYLKSIKIEESKNGDVRKQKKPYIYHKQMNFIQPCCEKRKSERNMTKDKGTSSLNNSTKIGDETTKTKAPTVLEQILHLPKKRKYNSVEMEENNVLKNTSEPSTSKLQDPDEMFLLSQLPIIKQMNKYDKLDFQIKFMQLLQSYNKPSICHLQLEEDSYQPQSVQSNQSTLQTEENDE